MIRAFSPQLNRIIHVRCDGRAPCSRCFRLCLKCTQPARKPYSRRGRSDEGEGEEADEEQHEEEEEGQADAGKSGGTKKRQRDGSARFEADATPLLDLIMARNDHGGRQRRQWWGHCSTIDQLTLFGCLKHITSGNVTLYMRAFNRLAGEGRLIRERVLDMM